MKTKEGLGFVLVLFSSLSSLLGAPDDLPVAETFTGLVRGKWTSSRSGRKYAEFKGIPYAKPPVGSLRLKAPEPAERWEGVRDAFNFSSYCVQQVRNPVLLPDMTGDEDCLYLSVYSHNLTGNAPVLFHIHGGAFVLGNGNTDPAYLMDEDLVVVSINYRLNLLGFFSLETEELRGNQGLKDQVLALKWVQENIAAFGGDPNLVTIHGGSAGGASVHLQTMSPLTKGLFHRVIAESGSAYAPWAVSPPGVAKLKAEIILEVLGCPKTPKEALSCIQGMDAKKIASAYFNTIPHPLANYPYEIQTMVALEPPGDEAFLTGPISSWQPHPVPLILSTTSAEGTIVTLRLVSNGNTIEVVSKIFDKEAPDFLLYRDTAPEPDEITKQVKNFYLGQGDITMNDWVNFTTMFSDDLIIIPVLDAANLHSADVYLYYFDYISQSVPYNPLVFGAMHTAETEFIWGGGNKFILEKEHSLSKNLVKMIANFAKTGVPSGLPEQWKKWTKTEQHYMEVDRSAEFHLKKGLAQDRYNFWKSLDYRKKFEQ